ncbi:MAG: hypothetical protein WBL42_07690 [Methanoregula sp.]
MFRPPTNVRGTSRLHYAEDLRERGREILPEVIRPQAHHKIERPVTNRDRMDIRDYRDNT